MKISEAKKIILSNDENSKLNLDFIKLYGKDSKVLENQKQRYINALEKFSKLYPNNQEIEIYSASGRTEIGGNHTDHQHGCVLAAAVNLDVIGIVAFHNEKVIRVKSEGYDAFEVELSDLSVKKGETGSAAIIRGIASKFASSCSSSLAISVSPTAFPAYPNNPPFTAIVIVTATRISITIMVITSAINVIPLFVFCILCFEFCSLVIFIFIPP